MAVVDASVIVAAVINDNPFHEACRSWLDALINLEQSFSAPSILLNEVAAPLSRGFAQQEFAKEIIQEFVLAPYAKLVPVSIPLARRAAVIAADYKIRGCDAVYVALAEVLDEELITLDKQQSDRAKSIIAVRQP